MSVLVPHLPGTLREKSTIITINYGHKLWVQCWVQPSRKRSRHSSPCWSWSALTNPPGTLQNSALLQTYNTAGVYPEMVSASTCFLFCFQSNSSASFTSPEACAHVHNNNKFSQCTNRNSNRFNTFFFRQQQIKLTIVHLDCLVYGGSIEVLCP